MSLNGYCDLVVVTDDDQVLKLKWVVEPAPSSWLLAAHHSAQTAANEANKLRRVDPPAAAAHIARLITDAEDQLQQLQQHNSGVRKKRQQVLQRSLRRLIANAENFTSDVDAMVCG